MWSGHNDEQKMKSSPSKCIRHYALCSNLLCLQVELQLNQLAISTLIQCIQTVNSAHLLLQMFSCKKLLKVTQIKIH
jgi:hypothetical protein